MRQEKRKQKDGGWRGEEREKWREEEEKRKK